MLQVEGLQEAGESGKAQVRTRGTMSGMLTTRSILTLASGPAKRSAYAWFPDQAHSTEVLSIFLPAWSRFEKMVMAGKETGEMKQVLGPYPHEAPQK